MQELLKKNELVYLQKAAPVFWVLPVWIQGSNRWTLEDENPFYQLLKRQYPLSNLFQMILPNGDIDELILTEQSLDMQDFSKMSSQLNSRKAERVLVVEVLYGPDGHWEMTLPSYTGTENTFTGIRESGEGVESLLGGWQRLNAKMAERWQEKYRRSENASETYYARFHLPRLAAWGQLKRDLKKLTFLENLTLQGAMSDQVLLSFTYPDGMFELMNQLDKAGFVWEPDSGNLGTLKRKDYYENIL